MHIYGSYRKIKTGVSLFGPPGIRYAAVQGSMNYDIGLLTKSQMGNILT